MSFSGERLRTARKHKKLTIDKLIEEVNENYDMKLNNGMVSKWENNKVMPRIDAVSVLAEYLEVPSDYLLGRKDLGNIVLDLRLKSGLSVKQLSEKSGVEHYSLIEIDVDFPDSEIELNNLGSALGIENLRSYIVNEGYFGPLTRDEYQGQKVNNQDSSGSNSDLSTLLIGSEDVYFNQRLLSTSEKDKIKRIIEIVLEDNEN